MPLWATSVQSSKHTTPRESAVASAAPPAPSPIMRMNQKLPATLMKLTTRLETIEIMLLPWLR